MHPLATIAIRLVVETCSSMVVCKALSPLAQSATGLTKVAIKIGIFGVSAAVAANAGMVITDSIDEGIKTGKEIVEVED